VQLKQLTQNSCDMTWHFGILQNHHQWKLRGSLPLLSSFLWDHHVCVCLGSTLSHTHQQENKLSQRSILNVTLFAIAVSDIPSAVCPSVPTSLHQEHHYLLWSSCLNTLKHWLQAITNQISQQALENGFSIFAAQNIVCVLYLQTRYTPHHLS